MQVLRMAKIYKDKTRRERQKYVNTGTQSEKQNSLIRAYWRIQKT